jgi:cell wall-associated NlpC family hydrolase
LTFGICDLTAIPLRANPSNKSEMVSQLLLGEVFEVREKKQPWLRIHTHCDDYDGWVDEKQVQEIEQTLFLELTSSPNCCALEPFTFAESNIRKLTVFKGSSLPNYENQSFKINDELFQFSAPISEGLSQNLSEQIPAFAMSFLNMPYLWGGRSPAGIDCSGFTNIVYKLAGIKLRRDAWQQSEQGILISFIDEARPGDLAFFQNEEGKIIHVGIILQQQKIIHASGRVRIDTIDHYGIYNEELKKYTHQLRLIRRIIN